MVDEKQQLRDEAAAMTPEPESVEAPSDQPARPDELQAAVAGAVNVIGVYACARYRVTPLEPDECRMMSGALLNVARVYGLLDRADPKIMAWLTLGGVGMTIMANRRPLPQPEPEHADQSAAA
ncbi:MAG TPA: hypothetical protein VF194_19630 [Ferrovibrio sp.]|uniref:hypothetical protein n=1 Tax=Ferrovibrio sp. TaxID=1917215 RepID=UPI002ED5427F